MSVVCIFLLIFNNIMKIDKMLHTNWAYGVAGFVFIDGIQHYIWKVVDGKNKVCLFDKNGKLKLENIGGTTFGLLIRVWKYRVGLKFKV